MSATIRKIEPRDHARWLELWEGYCRFYERTLSEPKTRHTWATASWTPLRPCTRSSPSAQADA